MKLQSFSLSNDKSNLDSKSKGIHAKTQSRKGTQRKPLRVLFFFGSSLSGLGLLLAFTLATGCSKNSTGPEETLDDLSETEQMTIISNEVAEASGGVMTDLHVAGTSTTGSFSALGKAAGFDTTITKNWITYKLSLRFYNERGVEQSRYILGVTDSITYQSTLSGNRSNAGTTIALNSGSTLNAAEVKSGKVLINGQGVNNSTYGFAGNKRTVNIAAASVYLVKNVLIDVKGGNYVPTSGTIEGTLKGKFSADGAKNSQQKDYAFTFTLAFNGSNQVTVTLPNGKQFTLNLLTGQIS
jgi:hypothetical protein